MNVAFRCRIQYGSDVTKIRKFFEDTDTLRIAAGKVGISLYDISSRSRCYNIAAIHASDIYRLYVNTEMAEWKYGGIFRAMPAAQFISFMKSKEVDDDIQFEIDDNATELTLSVMDGDHVVRATKIPLTIPDIAYEYPSLTNANVVIKVNEFKKLCSDMAKASSEIKVEYQDDAIRFTAGTHKVSYGSLDEKKPIHTCGIKNDAFLRATKINIGNTKNSLAGIYIQPNHPLMIKVKLGTVDFMIYSKVFVS